MRHDAAPRVEGVLHRVLQQVGDVRRVDISKTEQPSREVGGIVIRTEHTPKLLVEYTLHRMPAALSSVKRLKENVRFGAGQY